MQKTVLQTSATSFWYSIWKLCWLQETRSSSEAVQGIPAALPWHDPRRISQQVLKSTTGRGGSSPPVFSNGIHFFFALAHATTATPFATAAPRSIQFCDRKQGEMHLSKHEAAAPPQLKHSEQQAVPSVHWSPWTATQAIAKARMAHKAPVEDCIFLSHNCKWSTSDELITEHDALLFVVGGGVVIEAIGNSVNGDRSTNFECVLWRHTEIKQSPLLGGKITLN